MLGLYQGFHSAYRIVHGLCAVLRLGFPLGSRGTGSVLSFLIRASI